MGCPAEIDPERLLTQAKGGDGPTLGWLLERYRNYLKLLIRLEIGRRLQGKLDVEDVLQEISLAVHRHIGQFRGETEAEFLAWLRKIMAAVLSNQLRRYYGTQGRDPRRERQIAADLDASSRALDGGLIAPHSSPSQQAARREQAVILADALGGLPESYREVIILRQLQGLSFPEVARRMEKTEDSVKNLWIRALARLRRVLEEKP